MSFFGFNIDISAMSFYDSICRCQSKSRTQPHFLGGKKRLENACDGFLVHSRTVVFYLHHNILAGFGSIRLVFHFFMRNIGSLQKQISSSRHGIGGIDKKIDENLFNLRSIRLYREQIFSKVRGNDNLLSCPAECSRTFFYDFV